MKPTNLFAKIAGVAAIASSTFVISVPTLAQFFNVYYFPSSYFSPSPSLYQSEDEINLTQLLKANNQFKKIASYLEKADLTETLAEDGVTLFAPTDKAFQSLPVATQRKLADPENLTKLLQYHIVVGQITDDEIKRQEVATLLGTPVKIVGVSVANKLQLKLNEATAGEPLSATNGVIIPLDKVLLPPGF
jgi:uncharacterized surface protein with fasciclin (FAS1) repeats